jgi:hypothetical protein
MERMFASAYTVDGDAKAELKLHPEGDLVLWAEARTEIARLTDRIAELEAQLAEEQKFRGFVKQAINANDEDDLEVQLSEQLDDIDDARRDSEIAWAWLRDFKEFLSEGKKHWKFPHPRVIENIDYLIEFGGAHTDSVRTLRAALDTAKDGGA